MRLAVLTVLILAAGCATRPSLEQLEQEALATGEWSAVEAREAALARQERRLGPECPRGAVSVCYETGLAVDCGCVVPRGGRGVGGLVVPSVH
ncbi:MAG: hypothetical protein R3176_10965 [Woeseiaceae bacterium]|nr:hypothetical protein [Woeseiaceae bacterium]